MPHILESVSGGVIIRAERYMLRVTAAHLIHTVNRGFVRADQLVPRSDWLSQVEEHDDAPHSGSPLLLESVEREAQPQRYFGLNCPSGSTVLANGIRASTFDTYHLLPSIWMRGVSALFGVERASQWGDAVASAWWGEVKRE